MAEAVGKTGASRRTRVHEWETGRRQPDLYGLLRYARLAGVPVDVLIDDSLELDLSRAELRRNDEDYSTLLQG